MRQGCNSTTYEEAVRVKKGLSHHIDTQQKKTSIKNTDQTIIFLYVTTKKTQKQRSLAVTDSWFNIMNIN